MNRLFITAALAMFLTLPLFAQAEKEYTAPELGTVKVELLMGTTGFFQQDYADGYHYLLAADNGSSIGFGEGLKSYMNLGDMNSNSILNMVGVKTSVYVHPQIDVNVLFGMNINMTPKKDYIEGDYYVPDMPIPSQDYITAETEHLLFTQVGANWHFLPKNKRISPYAGVVGGFQFARIAAMYPYTGETDAAGDPIELTRASYRAGQAWALQGGIVAGVDYQVAPGLSLGVEIFPAMYQYTVMELHPSGMEPYWATNHHIKLLTAPRLKLGFTFGF